MDAFEHLTSALHSARVQYHLTALPDGSVILDISDPQKFCSWMGFPGHVINFKFDDEGALIGVGADN